MAVQIGSQQETHRGSRDKCVRAVSRADITKPKRDGTQLPETATSTVEGEPASGSKLMY